MRHSQARAKTQLKTIFAGNLPPKTTKKELNSHFSRFGKVQKIIFREKNGRLYKNSASIVFQNHHSFRNTLEWPHPHFIRGFVIKVEKEVRGKELLNVEADISKRRVYIKNIPFAATEKELVNLIETSFGDIELCYICKDKRGPKSKTDYGFVTLSNPQVAEKILNVGTLKFLEYQTKLVFRAFKQKGSSNTAPKPYFGRTGVKERRATGIKGRKTSALTSTKDNRPGLDFSFERAKSGGILTKFHSKVLAKIRKNHISFNMRFNK